MDDGVHLRELTVVFNDLVEELTRMAVQAEARQKVAEELKEKERREEEECQKLREQEVEQRKELTALKRRIESAERKSKAAKTTSKGDGR